MTDPSASFATPRVAAGALFFDDRGRVLLVHPTYKDTWDIPGGYVEARRVSGRGLPSRTKPRSAERLRAVILIPK